MKNWLYTFQRYTGVIAFAYIGWHVYHATLGLRTGCRRTAKVGAGRCGIRGLSLSWSWGWWLRHFILGVGIWNFSLQVGTGSDRRERNGAAGQLGAAVGVIFSLVGILIVASFSVQLASLRFVFNAEMRQPKIIVVGGGLAGPDGHDSCGRGGACRWSFFFRSCRVKRSHSVLRAKAGLTRRRIKRARAILRRSTLTTRFYGGDFLANQTAGEAHVRKRRRELSICWTAWA